MLVHATMTTNYSKGTTFPYDPSFPLRLNRHRRINNNKNKKKFFIFISKAKLCKKGRGHRGNRRFPYNMEASSLNKGSDLDGSTGLTFINSLSVAGFFSSGLGD